MRTASAVKEGRSAVALVEQRKEAKPVAPPVATSKATSRTRESAVPAVVSAGSAGAAAKQVAQKAASRTAKGASKRPAKAAKLKLAKSAPRPSRPAPRARGARGRSRATPQPIRVVKIKELNAQGKCGPGTSVVHLFRVDEVCDGAAAVHLVFFDRHGWYCEHGRSCPAVDDVRKMAGSHLARTI